MRSWYRHFAKRACDIGLAAVLLILFLPLLALLALRVRQKLGTPVLFRQKRPGLNGKTFELCKFRTMTDGRDENGQLLPDEIRLTDFGKWLRATSLDELPELWNILRGEMSFVGPRPLLPQYLPLYSREQSRRHNVRPGLTGWAQINGRNATTWEDRLSRDVWYVDHMSFWLDVKILAKTASKVLFREGISAEGAATMPAFTGNSAPVDPPATPRRAA